MRSSVLKKESGLEQSFFFFKEAVLCWFAFVSQLRGSYKETGNRLINSCSLHISPVFARAEASVTCKKPFGTKASSDVRVGCGFHWKIMWIGVKPPFPFPSYPANNTRVDNGSILTMVYWLQRNIQMNSGVPGEIGWTARMGLNAWWRRESEEQTKGDLGVWGTNGVDFLHRHLKT